ncbi:MAG: hypothetical protein KJP07_18345, partial [Desulfatitalea sp.]|nr:hypothetical protein [Desulfatitalea sp.]
NAQPRPSQVAPDTTGFIIAPMAAAAPWIQPPSAGATPPKRSRLPWSTSFKNTYRKTASTPGVSFQWATRSRLPGRRQT